MNMEEPLSYDQITDHLYVGARPQPGDWFELAALGITVDVDLQVEGQDRFYKNVPDVYLWLPTPDWYGPNSQMLMTATQFIRMMIAQDRIVYVHCSMGVGRSPAVAVAYLVTLGMTVSAALAIVQAKRPTIKLNKTQIAHLHEFATMWTQQQEK
jgi:protein-tyrosine phosphatase